MEDQAWTAEVGHTLNGSLYVHNKLPLPTGWLEIGLISDIPGHECNGGTRLPARGWEKWKTQGCCCARGVYNVGPLIARSSDVLGLFRVERTYGAPVKVLVYPPVVQLPDFHIPAADTSGEEGLLHRQQTRSAHAGSLREYHDGDSLNRIHWPSTARCGRLMSKEFDSGHGKDVWIVLDLECGIHVSAGAERTDEYAVAIAASLTKLALTEESPVGLIAYGDQEYSMAPGVGASQMTGVLDMLASSKTEGDAPLIDLLVDNMATLGRCDSLLVVTSSTAIEWVSVLQDMMYRGLGIAVVLVDATSFGSDRPCHEVSKSLISAGIPLYVVRRGDSLPLVLARPAAAHDQEISERCCGDELTPASVN